MTRLQIVLFGLALLLCLACDQATKQVASSALGSTGPVSLAGDLVRFELATNPGAFLSLGADFVSLGVGSLRTGIFNVADVAIVAGALLLAFGPLRRAPSEEAS